MSKNYLEEIKKEILETAYEEKIAKSDPPLLPERLVKQKIALELETAVTALNDVFANGFVCLYEAYQKSKAIAGPKIDFLELDDLFLSQAGSELEISPNFLTKLQNIDVESICHAHNLLEVTIQEGNSKDARDALYLLINIVQDFPPLLSSLGFVEYTLKNYEAAVTAYTTAAVLEPENPEPLLHSAYCLKESNNMQEALVYIDRAILIIDCRPEFAEFKQASEELKASIMAA